MSGARLPAALETTPGDGGVSKTVQLPPDVSVERIALLIERARALGCKGGA